MNWLRKLWSRWFGAVGAAPRGAPSFGPEVASLRRLVRRPLRRMDARGLQGLLDDAYCARAAAPAEVEEPPRKAVGS